MAEKLIDDFFNKKLITSSNTKRSYRGNIRKFFRIIEKNMDTYFKNKTLNDYEKDLNKVYMFLEKEETPLLTRKTFFNTIKQLLCTMDKECKKLDFWEILKTRLRGASPISIEHVPNAKDIKTVLSHGNALSRAMYLMMACTGMRIGELLALYPEDIKTDIDPTMILIKRSYDRKKPGNVKNLTKTKKSRICFITPETKDAYVSWMKERDAYLDQAVRKSKHTKSANDKRIFPMSDENAREIWANLVRKSGLYQKDTETGRLTLHPHCLRKFMRSYFGHADLAEHFIGHATGMDKYYRNMKKEDLAEKYIEFMHNVTIFGGTSDSKRINGLQEQLNEKDKEIDELRHQMETMRNQMNILMADKLISIDKGR